MTGFYGPLDNHLFFPATIQTGRFSRLHSDEPAHSGPDRVEMREKARVACSRNDREPGIGHFAVSCENRIERRIAVELARYEA